MKDYPANFRHVRMELAREKGMPVGDDDHGYDILVPLLDDGRIDGETATKHKQKCRVRRFRPGEADAIGILARGPGGHWHFDYNDGASSDAESGFRFEDEHFVRGEYISVREDDGDMHTFRVTLVEML